MYGIYANIGGILMGSMLPYIAYMDPMGIYRKNQDPPWFAGCQPFQPPGSVDPAGTLGKWLRVFSRRHGLQTGAHCGSLAKDLEGANFFEDSADIIVADSEKPQHGF